MLSKTDGTARLGKHAKTRKFRTNVSRQAFSLFSSSTVMSILVLPFMVLASEVNLLAATQIKVAFDL